MFKGIHFRPSSKAKDTVLVSLHITLLMHTATQVPPSQCGFSFSFSLTKYSSLSVFLSYILVMHDSDELSIHSFQMY